jgi:hypothetical protein
LDVHTETLYTRQDGTRSYGENIGGFTYRLWATSIDASSSWRSLLRLALAVEARRRTVDGAGQLHGSHRREDEAVREQHNREVPRAANANARPTRSRFVPPIE